MKQEVPQSQYQGDLLQDHQHRLPLDPGLGKGLDLRLVWFDYLAFEQVVCLELPDHLEDIHHISLPFLNLCHL